MEVVYFTNKNQDITGFSGIRFHQNLIQIWVLAPLNPVYDRVLMFLSGMEVVWKYHFFFVIVCYNLLPYFELLLQILNITFF